MTSRTHPKLSSELKNGFLVVDIDEKSLGGAEMVGKRKNSYAEQGEDVLSKMGEVEKKAFASNPEAESSKSTKPRLSVTLKEDGSIDFDSMRTDTVNKLKDVLRNPKTQELLGNAANLPELISDDDVRMLYDLIAMIEAYAFTFAGKVDFDIAQRHAAFTDQQKNMLLPSTKNVIIKNADKMAFAIRWKDEIILTMLLLTITRAKYEGARKDQAARNEQKVQDNPATQETAVM